jgi:hypothetical protein
MSSRVLVAKVCGELAKGQKNDNGHTNGKLNHNIRLPIRLHLELKFTMRLIMSTITAPVNPAPDSFEQFPRNAAAEE